MHRIVLAALIAFAVAVAPKDARQTIINNWTKYPQGDKQKCIDTKGLSTKLCRVAHLP